MATVKEKRVITLAELKEKNCSTWSRKDNSIRGCCTVHLSELHVGDEVLIDNYFTLITE